MLVTHKALASHELSIAAYDVIPGPDRRKQEDQKFEATLDYTGSSRSDWTAWNSILTGERDRGRETETE